MACMYVRMHSGVVLLLLVSPWVSLITVGVVGMHAVGVIAIYVADILSEAAVCVKRGRHRITVRPRRHRFEHLPKPSKHKHWWRGLFRPYRVLTLTAMTYKKPSAPVTGAGAQLRDRAAADLPRVHLRRVQMGSHVLVISCFFSRRRVLPSPH